MPLQAGVRLGPYEIVAPLGAGGMGEVYRAKDTRLGREVAVKVLPQHLSASAEVRTRFEREARTVSGLNHPNICTLFDVGREGGTDYLVMELVEGETLAQRLARGALPPAEVLRLGAQVADALDRAHRAGVIHRDLKPGNVMLTRSGAKLMDFGLARATGMAGPAGASGATVAALTQSPTVAQPLTAEGTIVGTFQYMSPEQLEGREADARSDLWALGCVLYEMATGTRAFEGRSQASLITAIMGSEPRAVSEIAPLMPQGLDRIVRACLAKDPDERVQTAHDVKLRLRDLAEGVSQAGAPAPAVARGAAHGRWPWAIALLAALVAAVLALLPRERALPRAVQLSLVAPEGAAFPPFASTLAISPDGRTVAYVAADSSREFDVWVQPLEASTPVRLMHAQRLPVLFWAPDSRALGIVDPAHDELLKVSTSGGSPVSLCAAGNARGGSWSRRGVIVFAPSVSGPLYRVSAGGGQPVQCSWPDSSRHESGHRYPCFLPDGRHFLYLSLPPGPDGYDVWVGSLGSRTARKLMTAGSAPTYARPGWLLFRRAGNVMAQRFDARALALRGDPVVLGEAPPLTDIDAEPIASASDDGRLVMIDARTPDTRLVWLGRDGSLGVPLSLPAGQWGPPRLSPDGRFAAETNGPDLWRVDLGRSVAVRLTSNAGANSNPAWSPDGTRIAFRTTRTGSEEVMVMNADGSGSPQLVPTTADLFKHPVEWSSRGLLVSSINRETFRDVWLVPSTGAPVPLFRSRFGEDMPAVSPDGRWIAYLSDEAGHDDVYLESFPVLGHKVRVSTDGASRVWWVPGSDELRYRTASGAEMVAVTLTPRGGDVEVGAPRVVLRFPPEVLGIDLARDGQRVLACVPASGAQARSIRVILGWTALVKR